MFPDVAVDENGDQGEDRADDHADLHAQLGRCGLPCDSKLRNLGACNGGVGDDADELRANRSAQIAGGGHHGEDEYAAGGEALGSYHKVAGPQHGGAEAGQCAGDEADDREGAKGADQIAGGSADGAKGKNFSNVFAPFGVQTAAGAQCGGEHGNAEDVAPNLGDAQCLLQIAGAPLRHDDLCAAAKENGSDADPEPFVAEVLQCAADPAGGLHFGELGADEQNGGGQRDQQEEKCEEIPVFAAE